MTTHKKAVRCANTETAKTAGQSTKARTIIMHVAAAFCKLLGALALSAVVAGILIAALLDSPALCIGTAVPFALSWSMFYIGEVLE